MVEALGQYVVIEDGQVIHIEEASSEIRSKSVGGISDDMLILLERTPRETLTHINKGKPMVLKRLGIYIEERDFFVESTFVEEVLADTLGYKTKEIEFNNLDNLNIPVDEQYTVVWG